MARGINKVILIGNLGKDPEIRYMPNGDPVANVNLATNEEWKDKKTSEPVTRTDWHRLVLFKGLAEIAKEHLKSGSQIYIEGSNRTRKYSDSDNIDRYVTEIVVREMRMLGNRPATDTEKNGELSLDETPVLSSDEDAHYQSLAEVSGVDSDLASMGMNK